MQAGLYMTLGFMAATALVLIWGILAMVRGGSWNRQNSNKLMRWRVGLQAAALGCFVIFLLAQGS